MKKMRALPKIVCFGGGRAMPDAVLSGLKNRAVSITSITSMTDSGGSTGQLRRDFGVLPPGDIRRHLLALSCAPEWKKELFRMRFGHEEFEGGHRGHTFGNVFIAGLQQVLKDYEKALRIVHEFLEVNGKCLPATTESVTLAAVLENGERIFGEDEIDIAKKHNPHIKIKEIHLKPQAMAYPPAAAAIKAAGIIAIGPGDLYSSILPCFLPRGIKDAMQKTKAKKILICPAMTKLGETQKFSVLDFAAEAEKYIGCGLDFVIFNTEIPAKARLEQHKKEEPQLLEPTEFGGIVSGGKFLGKNLLSKTGPVIYDPKKVADCLLELL